VTSSRCRRAMLALTALTFANAVAVQRAHEPSDGVSKWIKAHAAPMTRSGDTGFVLSPVAAITGPAFAGRGGAESVTSNG
jgi:hypothetical protein